MLTRISRSLAAESQRLLQRSRNMIRILRKPRADVGQTPHHIVFQRDTMSVARYDRPADSVTAAQALPVLIIPSLINRSYILDLQPGKSFVEYLRDQGFDVFLADWGKPQAEAQYISFDDYIELWIGGAVRRVLRLTGAPKLHLVGHCLGGMLTMIYASLHQKQIVSLLNITTPIDLRHGGILKQWTDPMDVALMTEALGNAPWPLLQSTFHMMKPMGLLQKTAWIYENLWNDHTVNSFMALETWSNDNVSIPGSFFRTYIHELYQNNALYEGTLTIHGRAVDLKRLHVPVMNVAAEGDHIAPQASVFALKDHIPHTQNISRAGGHIGGVISRRASKQLWPDIADFLSQASSTLEQGVSP